MSGFNYDDTDVPDETIRAVCAEIAGERLNPLTDAEIARREIEREIQRMEYARFEQEWAARHERERVAKAETAQRDAAIAAKAERDKAQRERSKQFDRELRRRDMLDLRLAAARQDTFQRNVESAHRNAVAYQQRQTILLIRQNRHLSALLLPNRTKNRAVILALTSTSRHGPAVVGAGFNNWWPLRSGEVAVLVGPRLAVSRSRNPPRPLEHKNKKAPWP